jgi:hypothetical protein
VIIAIGFACVVLGIGLMIYGAIPEPAWYFKATMDRMNGIPFKSTQQMEFGPFVSAEVAKQASDSLSATEKTIVYRWP